MKIFNSKKLMPALLAALFLFSSCRNPNDQPATEEEITEGGETIISEITTEEPTTTQTTITETETTETTEEPTTTEPPETEPPEPETTASVIETAESQTTATATEQTTVTTEETTTETDETTVTEPEIEPVEGLPDIIFIDLHCPAGFFEAMYGYFIDNRGLVKKFQLKWEYIDFNDHYANYPFFKNRDNVNYGGILISERYEEIIKTAIDTDIAIEKDKLLELNNKLLEVDKNSEITGVKGDAGQLNIGFDFDNYYGIRMRSDGSKEIILLGGNGDMNYTSSDIYANEVYEYFYSNYKNIFPFQDQRKWEEDFKYEKYGGKNNE